MINNISVLLLTSTFISNRFTQKQTQKRHLAICAVTNWRTVQQVDRDVHKYLCVNLIRYQNISSNIIHNNVNHFICSLTEISKKLIQNIDNSFQNQQATTYFHSLSLFGTSPTIILHSKQIHVIHILNVKTHFLSKYGYLRKKPLFLQKKYMISLLLNKCQISKVKNIRKQ